MLKCASVYTYELDDPKVAFDEIKTQLDSQMELLSNSIGIVMCHPEFIASGIAEYVCKSIPFDVAGATTSSQAVNGEFGEIILTLFVMTSDEVVFRAGVTGGLGDNIDEPTEEAWRNASAGIDAPVKLALIFPPFLTGTSGDAYLRAWEKIIPDTPIFGMLPADDSTDFRACASIFRGESHESGMAFILCYGNINPRFLMYGVPDDSRLTPRVGTVTKAAGIYVYEIDGIKSSAYLEKHGYTRHLHSIEHFRLTPFTVKLSRQNVLDETSVTKGITGFTEDGAAIFLSDVDEGSFITPLPCSGEALMDSVARSAKELGDMPDVNGVLLFSCIVRRMILLGTDPLSEFKAFRNCIRPGIPFMMSYANGEICPISMRDGMPLNRHHNYTLIILAV